MNNSVELEAKSESTVPTDNGTNPVVKKTVSKPRSAAKPKPAPKPKPVSKPVSKEVSGNPEVLFIVEEIPAEVVLNTIEVIDQKSVIGEEKSKKQKKSKQKAVKGSTLCKLVKNDYLKKHFAEYVDLVKNPIFICKKCGRTANSPILLCKPRFLNKQETMDASAQL